MRDFIRYYKWHLIFFLLVAMCATYVVVKLTEDRSSDLIVGYIGTQYVNNQTFNDNKAQFEILLHDSNEDGKKSAAMVVNIFDRQRDIDEAFVEMVEDDQYDLYIGEKETFENFEDKSRFEDASVYLSFGDKNIPVLEDPSGRIYAISIEGNDYATSMGINNSEDIYIAVASPKQGEDLTINRKNARNIAQYIIEEG